MHLLCLYSLTFQIQNLEFFRHRLFVRQAVQFQGLELVSAPQDNKEAGWIT